MICWRSFIVFVAVFSSADAQGRLGKKDKEPRPEKPEKPEKNKDPRPVVTPASPTPAPVPSALPIPAPSGQPLSAVPTAPVTQALVRDLETAIADSFGLEASYDELCESCVKGDNMGALVRLGFHDAAGGGGRFNGCIDFNEDGHKGLEDVFDQLRSVWAPFASKISFADTIVIAANLATSMASQYGVLKDGVLPVVNTNGIDLGTFRAGRLDDATCDDILQLPGKDFTWAQTQDWFSTRFGSTNQDIVALNGAHALGRCEFKNSGVEGGWTRYQSSFSNIYYSRMIGVGVPPNSAEINPWEQCTGTNCRNNVDVIDIWQNSQFEILLKSDVEMVISPSDDCFAFSGAAVGGGGVPASANGVKSESVASVCPLNDAANGAGAFEIVQGFAANTEAWWVAYSSAWQMLVDAGHDNLYVPSP